MTPSFARAVALIGLTFGAANAASAQPSANWDGVYEHTETIPTLSGATGSITYTLSLSRAGCRLTAQGLQTDEDIRCTARRSGNSVQIGFISYADGGTRNRFGVVRYRRGEALLRLTRSRSGLVTAWQGFTMSDARRRTGRFLTRR